MKLEEFYETVGGDLEEVLSRLPSEGMILRFLRKVPEDSVYEQLKAALEAEDLPAAFRAAHTMKGTTVTLGLNTLAGAASELTEQLRGASEMPPQELVSAVDVSYEAAIRAIRELDA